jgi:hypothetical protein
MTGTHAQRPARLAQNEILYRQVNERIEDINKAFDGVAALEGEWVCECADANCTTTVFATVEEYESVRANSRTFIVAPGHVDPYIEHVVRGNERFTVVEKTGAAGDAAEQQDTRT